MLNTRLFTSESVSEGHPDKIADRISDEILDALLMQDKNARVAVETFVKTGMVLVGGEITTNAWVDIESLVRQVVREIGYDDPAYGFDWQSCAVLTAIGKQSTDIALGVDETDNHPMGAGDQGMMIGYASDETDVLMPAPITYAHRLMQQQSALRKTGQLRWLRPDAKAQVTLIYRDGVPVMARDIVLSTQHDEAVSHVDLQQAVIEHIIKPVMPAAWLTNETRFWVNPTGRFVVGGPVADCGLTGRKIIVDTYGGMARHGGGAFSGKDPTKTDRSAAYAARYIAKNIVAAHIAKRCEVQLSYAIGVPEPISITLTTFGTAKVDEQQLEQVVREVFSLSPSGIIEMLNLLRPIYAKTAVYGHFGREDGEFPWESLDKVDILREKLNLS